MSKRTHADAVASDADPADDNAAKLQANYTDDAGNPASSVSEFAALPAELWAFIAMQSDPTGYRSLAATCRKGRRLLTQDEAQITAAKQNFTHIVVQETAVATSYVSCLPNGIRYGTSRIESVTGLVTFENHKDGMRHGPSTIYDARGNLLYSVNWDNDRKVGPHSEYYSSGVRKRSTYYEAGRLHGIDESWAENGQCILRSNWRAGQLHGTIETWAKNGVQTSLITYQNGKYDGLERHWTLNGQWIMDRTWKSSVLQSELTQWNRLGTWDDADSGPASAET